MSSEASEKHRSCRSGDKKVGRRSPDGVHAQPIAHRDLLDPDAVELLTRDRRVVCERRDRRCGRDVRSRRPEAFG